MKKMKYVLAFLYIVTTSTIASAKVLVAASIPDLASIASYVGGERVTTFAITHGNDNAHSVEVLPSYMIKVAKSDLYLKVGLQLDQWASGIIDGSRNRRLKVIDCSTGISVLEKPVGRVSAEQGDVHPDGNPHYWLDPSRAAIAAATIAEALALIDPNRASIYRMNAAKFAGEAENRKSEWKQRLSGAASHPLITYHRSWAYFTDVFGFTQAGYVEPIPGIPPTGSHQKDLIEIIKARGVKLLLEEAFYPSDAGEFLERQTGIKVIKADASCSGSEANSYFDHIEQLVRQIEDIR